MKRIVNILVAAAMLAAAPAYADPVLWFPAAGAWVPATTPVVVQGAVGATVTVTPDAGSPVSGTINGSGHIRLMPTFTGTGAHTFTVAHVASGVTTNLSGSIYVPAAGDLYTVPAGATAADITAALAAHQGVILTSGQTYSINQAVRVPSNRYFDGAGSTLALTNGANDYVVRNEHNTAGDAQIVIRNLVVNGNGTNQTRRETGPFSNQTTDATATCWTTDYCGMGMDFSFVNGLWLDGITLNSTNSWAVGYWASDLVMFGNIVLNAIPVGSGYNGDGVTGNARRVYVWNLSGYTNDDMIAVGTGLSTFQSGRFEGLTPAHNFDVEVVDIQGQTGGYPGGGDYAQGVAETGVGLYPCVGRTIKHVTINGQAGRFNYPFRFSDFWPGLGFPLGTIHQVHVTNRTSTGVQGLYRPAPAVGHTFDAKLLANGTSAALIGWQHEDESVNVTASGGNISGLAQHSPDATTWTATLAIGGASATATATRSSDSRAASVTVTAVPVAGVFRDRAGNAGVFRDRAGHSGTFKLR